MYSADDPSLPDVGYDRPSKFNKRLGYNAGSFQFEQNIPPRRNPWTAAREPMYANVSYLDDGTDASIFITVYAEEENESGVGLDLVTDDELTKLANQLHTLTTESGRDVFLRFCPEMQGSWFKYGGKPEQFVATWIRMANIFRKIAPSIVLVFLKKYYYFYFLLLFIHPYIVFLIAVALVWSPNFDLGDGTQYPPYWPGPEHVDWVGLSIYWKGSKTQTQTVNVNPPNDFFPAVIDGLGGEGGTSSFYKRFAEAFGKPFVVRARPTKKNN
jgi:hypothetical protein